jgi:hypothetical protein
MAFVGHAGVIRLEGAGGKPIRGAITGERKPFPFIQTPQFTKLTPKLSPDGRFIA